MSNKTKAIISGASGFIASHLIKSLKERNIEPIAIERNDLGDTGYLPIFIQQHNPSYIFSFHAYGNHGMQKERDEAIFTNYVKTWNLLSACNNIPYKAFINCSTSSIYGHQLEQMGENTILKPDTFYAASKAGAMYLARAYAKQYNKPIISVVPFSVFGEGEADWRFIPTACKYLVTGETMPFIGPPTHDWIYIDNLIDGILSVVDNASLKELHGDWVNIGTGGSWSNNAVLRILEEVSGRKLKKKETYKELEHHSRIWVADNNKLRSLGWRPKITFEEGLKRTWEFYKSKYESETVKT